MSDKGDSRPSNKVARLLDEYDLDGLGTELESKWTSEGSDRMSLRDLAAFFNKRLVEKSLQNAGLDALESDVERTYRHLTDEEVSSGIRTDTRTHIKQNGVDIDKLEHDFVTYQAIRSYLTKYRNVEYNHPSDADKIEGDRETIQRLISRTLSVTEDRLETLQETGRLDISEFEVLVDLRVICQNCGKQHRVGELLNRMGCDCQRES